MSFDSLKSPLTYLRSRLGPSVPDEAACARYDDWWQARGAAISSAIDRGGVPHLRQQDRFGQRRADILYPPEYRDLLLSGYREGIVSRYFIQETWLPFFALGYVTSFYDPGLYCPYTVTLATSHIVDKYAPKAIRARYFPRLNANDDSVWQGATWMTEARGGSDLGANVETRAELTDNGWRVTGDKHFCSNAGAQLALVVARPVGAPAGIRGLALFLVPCLREDSSPNYTIRRLKDKIATHAVPTGEVELRDSEAFLMGEPETGLALILEVLNLSRAANSISSVALAQRALFEALTFAETRVAFGQRLIDQPLMRYQFATRIADLEAAFALAWEAGKLGNETNREMPGLYSDTSLLYRLVTHLAKFWTAEIAVDTARWAMEVNGGAGTLRENGVERWLREAMMLDIWEGPPQRQILDGLEAMQRKNAHRLLFAALDEDTDDLHRSETLLKAHLALPDDEREAGAELIFGYLARFTGQALAARMKRQRESISLRDGEFSP